MFLAWQAAQRRATLRGRGRGGGGRQLLHPESRSEHSNPRFVTRDGPFSHHTLKSEHVMRMYLLKDLKIGCPSSKTTPALRSQQTEIRGGGGGHRDTRLGGRIEIRGGGFGGG